LCAKVTIFDYASLALACVFLAEACGPAMTDSILDRALVVIYCQVRNISKMRDRNGFTLLELAIAIVIALVVLSVAVPSVNGVLADRRLRRSLDGLTALVRQAQERSVVEHRSYIILMRDKKFALRAEGVSKGEGSGPIATIPWKRGESYRLWFPAAMEENPPAAWIFWSTGTCEPAVVSYQGPDGIWMAKFSTLTARPEIVQYVVR
jgi:prepilin-type N-terminal cleavage/methylation domain-containing protein